MKLIDETRATIPSRVVSCTYGNEVSSGGGNASLASKAALHRSDRWLGVSPR